MRNVIHTDDVPVAPDDFSQGWIAGDLIFTAGQVPMTTTGEVLLDASIAEQTRVCLENIEKILAEADATMDEVVKTTVFLDDIDSFDEMNAVYQEFFDGEMPARSVVEVATVLKGAGIKIEAVAARE